MKANRLLFIARHAKSSWEDATQHDSERLLNKRGERDAPDMGKRLAFPPDRPEHIVSSPAIRAIRTAEVFARCLGFDESDVAEDARIYHSDAADLVEIIREFDDRYQRIMLVGHNPALTDLLNLLSRAQIENMPTCSIATVIFDEKSWQRVRPGEGKLIAFEYPKR